MPIEEGPDAARAELSGPERAGALTAPDRWRVKGEPTPEELAAVVAVLASRGSAEAEPERPAPSRWSDRRRLVRQPLHPGPGAWRAYA
jgi:hypothetical protein